MSRCRLLPIVKPVPRPLGATLAVALCAACTGGPHYIGSDPDASLEDVDATPAPTDGGVDASVPPTLYRIVADDRDADDRFGIVSISGDTLAVGAPYDDDVANNSGAVYIFVWSSAQRRWEQSAKLKASDPLADNWFGSEVDLDGDVLAVGAPGLSVGAGVYVFERSGSNWAQLPKLVSGVNYDSFGAAVSLDGTYLAIGAPGDDTHQPQSGAVHVFKRDATTWSLDDKLTVSTSAQDDRVGVSVSLQGGRLAAGATGVDLTPGFGEGAVYIWEAAGFSWSLKPRLAYSVSSGGLGYGTSVSLSGDYLAVGVPKADRMGKSAADDTGAVSIYQRELGTGMWQHTQTVVASDQGVDWYLGTAVAMEGSVLVAGAAGANSNRGAAYRFDRASTWSESDIVVPSESVASDAFGSPVDIDGVRIAFGMTFDDAGAGAAYVLMP